MCVCRCVCVGVITSLLAKGDPFLSLVWGCVTYRCVRPLPLITLLPGHCQHPELLTSHRHVAHTHIHHTHTSHTHTHISHFNDLKWILASHACSAACSLHLCSPVSAQLVIADSTSPCLFRDFLLLPSLSLWPLGLFLVLGDLWPLLLYLTVWETDRDFPSSLCVLRCL